MQNVLELLPAVGTEVVRQDDTLRFSVTHWSRRIELSFTVHPSGRWGHLSRRAKYDPSQLKGTPSGRANLFYAVNAFNRAELGARLRLGSNELCFDRTVLLMRRATPKKLEATVECLLKASFSGIEALKPVREGTNWYEGTRALTSPQEDRDAKDLATVQGRMVEAGLEVQRESDALVCQRQGFEVRLSCSRGDLQATTLAIASSSPRSSIKLKLGEPVPACEALVTELDRRHAETPCTLSWDPKVGVLSGLTVRATPCRGADFELLLDTVVRPSALAELETLTKVIEDPSRA